MGEAGERSLDLLWLTLPESRPGRELAWLAGMRDDAPALYRALDLFVLPSQREGISNTILEAMASGLPVLATAVGGNPEIVADGVCTLADDQLVTTGAGAWPA